MCAQNGARQHELFSESAKEKGDIEMPAELRVIDEGISRFRDEHLVKLFPIFRYLCWLESMLTVKPEVREF